MSIRGDATLRCGAELELGCTDFHVQIKASSDYQPFRSGAVGGAFGVTSIVVSLIMHVHPRV